MDLKDSLDVLIDNRLLDTPEMHEHNGTKNMIKRYDCWFSFCLLCYCITSDLLCFATCS